MEISTTVPRLPAGDERVLTPTNIVANADSYAANMEAGAAAFHTSVASGIPDGHAFQRFASTGFDLANTIGDLTSPRYASIPDQAGLAHQYAERLQAATAAMPGIWSMPAEGMKPFALIQDASAQLAARLAEDTPLSTTSTANVASMTSVANDLRMAGNEAYAIPDPTVTTAAPTRAEGLRYAGLARAAQDSVLRIEDGVRANTQDPFGNPRARIQARSAIAELGRTASDAGALLPSALRETIDQQIAQLRGFTTPESVKQPQFVQVMNDLGASARTATDALDAHAQPFLADPVVQQWRTLPEGAFQNGSAVVPYWDWEIGV